MPTQVEVGDKEFKDSPDTGRIDCICSRCGSRIMAREFALRIFTGKERNTEYRYCQACQNKDMGITNLTNNDEDDDDDFWDENEF